MAVLPQQEGEIRLLQQQSGVVVDFAIAAKIWNSVALLRFSFFVVVVATVHQSLHDPFGVALLVLVVDNIGQRCSGRCCRRRGVGQLNIVVLWSKGRICSFGVNTNIFQRQRSSSLHGGGSKSSKTAALQKQRWVVAGLGVAAADHRPLCCSLKSTAMSDRLHFTP